MATAKLPFQNPHVTLVKDEVLEFNYHHKNFKVAVSGINRIYLSKRKPGYLSAMIGNLILSRTTGFKLFVHVKDNSTLTLDITSGDKYYFVSLISWVRTQIAKQAEMPVPKAINNKTAVVNQPVAA